MADKDIHEVVIQELAAVAKKARLEIPPKCFVAMNGRITDYEKGRSLTAQFPVEERYENPMGLMQGGFITAAIDNVFGPLSYLLGRPYATTQLDTSYLRPVAAADKYVEVAARVEEKAGRQLYMAAKVTNAAGKTVAISQASCQVVAPRRRTK